MSNGNSYLYLFTNPPIIIQFYQIGYSLTFLFGFFGNVASLLTFSRSTLRKVSTGCLFMALAISDLTFLTICIIDYIEFGWQVSLYGRVAYSELCRFRSFMMNFTQFVSAWILVAVSVDRWIRSRFPFKAASICTPRNAWITVGVVVIVSVGLHSHFFVSVFGMLVPGFANGACGPDFINRPYLMFYYFQWSVIQIIASCLLPAFLMSVTVCDISMTIRLHKRRVHQKNSFIDENRQKLIQRQIFILMLVSVGIFLITTLPLAIGKIIFPQQRDFLAAAISISTIWTGLGWFQSLNYTMNFYIHCLTSTLFRNEFRQQIKCSTKYLT